MNSIILFTSFDKQTEVNQLFQKRSVVELTEDQMVEVDAGTGPPCANAVTAVFGLAVGAYNLGHQFGAWLAS